MALAKWEDRGYYALRWVGCTGCEARCEEFSDQGQAKLRMHTMHPRPHCPNLTSCPVRTTAPPSVQGQQ